MVADIGRRQFLSMAGLGAAGMVVGPGARAAKPSRPDIVVIVLDTVRPDHLSCYGHTRSTTPFLDKLVSSARVYGNAYSTSCWTYPAHASLFTGLYAISHGTHWEHLRADDKQVTLAEILRGKGYQTLGLCENPTLTPGLGFAQGFERFVSPSPLLGRRKDTCAELEKALTTAGNGPLFLFVNLFAAHHPYNSSRQFFKLFLTEQDYAKAYNIDLVETIIKGKKLLTAEWLTHLAEHYDAEIRYVDYQIECLVAALKAHGRWDNTVFIVTSDHGENLGEHDLVDHQLVLYEPVVRIPLIIHYPDQFQPGTREDRCVQIIDIFPTVLTLAGIEPGEFPSPGCCLLTGQLSPDRDILCELYLHKALTIPSADASAEEWAHPRVRRFRRRLKALRVGPMKYIQGSDGTEELFDLASDPGETRSLAANPALASALQRMRARLAACLLRFSEYRIPSPDDPQTDEGADQVLKSVGYL